MRFPVAPSSRACNQCSRMTAAAAPPPIEPPAGWQDLRGDPAPLFLPEYAAFFGSDVALTAETASVVHTSPRSGVSVRSLSWV